MMKNISSQNSSKMFIGLIFVFLLNFWLLYKIGFIIHNSKQMNEKIKSIEDSNRSLEEKLEQKQIKLEYLQTPERLEKEAKIQMEKRLPGEKVLVIIEEEPEIQEKEEVFEDPAPIPPADVPNWKKWQWVLLHRNLKR